MGRILKKLFGFLFFALMANHHLFAHEVRPVYLEVKQTQTNEYHFKLKVPALGYYRLNISVVLPQMCDTARHFIREKTDNAFIDTWSVNCPQDLKGKQIVIRGLEGTLTDALVRIEMLDGNVQAALLTSGNPVLTIQKEPSVMDVVKSYFTLGVEHILLGIDHLLFVLGLLLITAGKWRILKTITAFTLAHSITLAMAALGVVNIPSAPVEAVISLSIVFVAYEALQTKRNDIAVQRPWLVAFIFGLLHGFGFAGALSATGLPQNSIAPALFFFNVGVEAGQLIFIVTVLLLMLVFKRILQRLPQTMHKIPAYVIGSLAMFWTIQRIVSFW